MNKIISALLIMGGIGLSFGAHAQTALNASSATTIGPEGSATADETCVLLGENVTLNLSRGVHGAYSCEEATNAIRIATCHETGSRKPTLVTCTPQGEAPDITYVPAGCTADTPNIEIADYRGFTANSRGGGVGTDDLGGKCEDTSVSALIAE